MGRNKNRNKKPVEIVNDKQPEVSNVLTEEQERLERTDALAEKIVAEDKAKTVEESVDVVKEESKVPEETTDPKLTNLTTAVSLVKDAVDLDKVERIDGSVVASKQFGLLKVIQAELGDKYNFKEMEDIIVKSNIHRPNVSHAGYLDWSFDVPARDTFAALMALIQLREGGGIIYKDNIVEQMTDGYSDLGDRITSMI